ncbi:hypothetical protein D9619_008163 [Psilocybe cf. subviscida]|uniref:GST N-terminal domain-containing protein n=1 Tax=Psilocybe cf. subviscida TaxID=2480587 RepID=A0A8H5AUC1_9AGAR|nr:hypothetical protein D9619_008163 [Psilocybe cf. subviscida]
MSIIFYDITTRSGETISPNSWKTRLSLILKRIPFELKQVPLHELYEILPREGIPPSSKNPDGSPFYTVPAIHDLSTGAKLSDSWEIALYLDKTYPNTQSLFPANTVALQRAFTDSFGAYFNAAWPFFLPRMRDIFIPETGPHFTATVESVVGRPFDEAIPQGEDGVREWERYKLGLNKLEEWYSASSGAFLMGDTPVWADLPVVALLIVQRRAFGKDSDQWKDITSWNGGRWLTLVSYFDDIDIA